MARAMHMTIATGDCIRLGARSGSYDEIDYENHEDENEPDEVRQEVRVGITYALDSGDTDLAALAWEKAGEVQQAHAAAWHRIGALKSSGLGSDNGIPENSGLRNAGCSCGRSQSGTEEQNEEQQDGDDRYPHDYYPDNPGDDPFGQGRPLRHDPPPVVPTAAGSVRPYPAAPTDTPQNGTRHQSVSPLQGGNQQSGDHQNWRHLPGASPNSPGASLDGTGSREPDQFVDPITGPQRILIRSQAKKVGLSTYALESLVFQQFKVWRLERLTKAQAASLLVALERDLKAKKDKEKNAEEGAPHADSSGFAATA